ncbi:MAG: threonylcarbamoyl-AMP synthase [Phycisphaerae bacterium]|nr:threonylcarbamoyl-AMP synthase [Phycisphaerae bacterium]
MKTEVMIIKPEDLEGEKIRAAARLLDAGQIVAFPTETVYGLGCVAEPEAIARLDEVKGRPADKRYTLHIGSREDVHRYVPCIGPRARKLVGRAWPGPLTIVFSLSDADLKKQKGIVSPGAFGVLYGGGTIGIRCVDNELGRALLRRAMGPVVAPSANRSGEKPAVTASEVYEVFGGKIAAILAAAGEPQASGQSSTVVRVTDTSIEMLREGLMSPATVTLMSQIKIMFVCTGNTCRSPMAAGFSRKLLSEKLKCGVDALESMGYIVMSCGLAGCGSSASPEAIAVCRERSVHIGNHRSRSLDCDELRDCDFVFGMTQHHVDTVRRCCPEIADKCAVLDADRDISDPIGGDLEAYRRCAVQIEKALGKRLGEIWDEDSSSK